MLLKECMDDTMVLQIREALAMPEANLDQMCERIRTLRQCEAAALYLIERAAQEHGSDNVVVARIIDDIYKEFLLKSLGNPGRDGARDC